MEVTSIQFQKRNRNRVSIYIDGKYTFSLDYVTFSRSGLHEGDSVTEEQINSLSQKDEFFRARDYALSLLSYRERTEHEMKSRLFQKGFTAGTVRSVIELLKDRGLIDDRSFAQKWVEGVILHRPMGRMRAAHELRKKHVGDGIIEDVCTRMFSLEDEITLARNAAQKKLGSMQGYPQELVKRRLNAFLKNRGFDFQIIQDLMKEYFSDRF